MTQSPTAKTLRFFREREFSIAVVERTVQTRHQTWKHDLFKVIDLVAVHNTGDVRGVVGIQATSMGNMGSRDDKILAHHNGGILAQPKKRGEEAKQEQIRPEQTSVQCQLPMK